jgi:hypothetical protein
MYGIKNTDDEQDDYCACHNGTGIDLILACIAP